MPARTVATDARDHRRQRQHRLDRRASQGRLSRGGRAPPRGLQARPLGRQRADAARALAGRPRLVGEARLYCRGLEIAPPRAQLPGVAILFIAGVAALIIAVLLAQPALRERRRRRLRAAPFPADWRAILHRRFPAYARLPFPERRELERRVQVFVAE